jgi:hypothetical protein
MTGTAGWKMRVGMSEYPCTGIDKAVLKFAPQACKKSQIVSVKVSVFFPTFVRQLLPDLALERRIARLSVGLCGGCRAFPTKLTAAPFVVILPHCRV